MTMRTAHDLDAPFVEATDEKIDLEVERLQARMYSESKRQEELERQKKEKRGGWIFLVWTVIGGALTFAVLSSTGWEGRYAMDRMVIGWFAWWGLGGLLHWLLTREL